MPGAYLWNFECIDGVYGKDDNAIYYLGVSISGADYETFETIKWSRFAKDKNNVYCFWNIVEWADAKTFIYSGEISDHSLLFWRENYGSQGHDKNKYKTYTCEDDTKF